MNERKVFYVPIKDNKQDYGKVEYNDKRFTEEDRKKIEVGILDIQNSSSLETDKVVKTSIGEILIRGKRHQEGYRVKTIEGFIAINRQDELLLPTAEATTKNSPLDRIIALLQETAPYCTEKYQCDILSNSIKNIQCDLDIPDKTDKVLIFIVLLEAIQTLAGKFGKDENSQVRIKNEITNIQLLCPINAKNETRESLFGKSSASDKVNLS